MLMDKETQIKNLKENKEQLELRVKFLQSVCRSAGAKIKQLENQLKEANQWKEEEVEKFRAKLRDTTVYEKRLDD